jgi:RimJ/RimL family protein N-acetyltransferase
VIWPPPPRALEGSIVRMEPLGREHLDGLQEAAGDAETWRWMDRRIPDEDIAFERWFETRMAGQAAHTEWPFATISVATGEPIGSSSYLTVRPDQHGLEIGWTWLNPSAWRTGANLEAKLLMLDHAFDDLGCMRVEFKTDSRNARSRTALEALGAQFEGIFRKHMMMPVTGVRDSAYYSIVDDDWPAVRNALTARLERGRKGAAARA